MMYAMRKAVVSSILFVVVLLAVAVIAETQQAPKIPWVGAFNLIEITCFVVLCKSRFRPGLTIFL
jgi:hypothetical protein